MTTPRGLGTAGKRLWKAVLDDLQGDEEFDGRELEILTTAARQADTVADLEVSVKRDGVMIDGAAGQRRLNAAVTELRQSRVALTRLLAELKVEAASEGKPYGVPRPGAENAA